LRVTIRQAAIRVRLPGRAWAGLLGDEPARLVIMPDQAAAPAASPRVTIRNAAAVPVRFRL